MRHLTPRQKTALRENTASSTMFLEFDHPDGYVRIWRGTGMIQDEFDFMWVGSGELVSFSGLNETERTKIDQLNFSVSRVPKDEARVQIKKDVRGRQGKLHYGIVNKDRRIIDNLITLQAFTISDVQLQEGDTASALIFNCISGFTDLTTPSNVLWSKAAQEAKIQDENILDQTTGEMLIDNGFNEMPAIADTVNLLWNTGAYRGLDDNRVQDETTVSGTKIPEPNPYRDFYVR